MRKTYLHLEELERDGDILQLLRPEDGLLVVPGEPFAREDLEERDELEAVSEVDLEVVDLLVGLLEVLVGPPREGILLDALPLGIRRQGAVHVGHGLLVKLLLPGARLLRLAAPAGEVVERGLVVGLRSSSSICLPISNPVLTYPMIPNQELADSQIIFSLK